jgi:hypothetical protein
MILSLVLAASHQYANTSLCHKLCVLHYIVKHADSPVHLCVLWKPELVGFLSCSSGRIISNHYCNKFSLLLQQILLQTVAVRFIHRHTFTYGCSRARCTICMYVCMYVCMYMRNTSRMYVYVCMYINTHTHTYI